MGNQNFQEVSIYVGVWLAKTWEVELPRKFYFLQHGRNNLPRPPQISGNSHEKQNFPCSTKQKNVLPRK